MNFFFDTNVILDYLIPTNSFHEEASKILKAVFEGKTNGFISAHSMTDIFYISRKYFSLEDRRQFLLLIASTFQIIAENSDDFLAVLNAENFFDLEDGLQMRCAENAKLDYIVTENLKDFKTSKVPALAISSALSKI
ncbi:MAG: PIN domain-containing protein [Spirochaetaceae bacterium]|nr:PIN domain-containing protein [Spirochaetaceae bacterium]